MSIRSLIVAVVVSNAVGYSPYSVTADEEFEKARGQVTAETARTFLQEHRGDVAPDGLSLPFGSCDPDSSGRARCEYNQALLIMQFSFAYRGAYEAQRSVAYCLIDGCDGALVPNYIMGCAWRIVIVASNSPRVDPVDVSNVRLCAEHLDRRSRKSTRHVAEALFATIYESVLPTDKVTAVAR